MILSKQDIIEAIKDGEIVYHGFPYETRETDGAKWIREWVQPASLDITIGPNVAAYREVLNTNKSQTRFYSTEHEAIDPAEDPAQHFIIKNMNDNPRKLGVIQPGGKVLAHSEFALELGNSIAAQLSTRSTAARWGLDVCGSAGWIDPGFKSYLTLEISNPTSRGIVIRPGMRLAQLVFFQVSHKTGSGYRGYYSVPREQWEPKHMLPKTLR